MKPNRTLPVLAITLCACADLTAPSGQGTSTGTSPEPVKSPGSQPRPAPQAPQEPTRDRISASHILIAYQGASRSKATRSKDEAKKLAESVLRRVQGGADFAAIAKETSDDAAAKASGGNLGSFDRYTMAKPFTDAAFALGVGQTSSVVETEFGFHIIKRTE